jgi:hypothetical protein
MLGSVTASTLPDDYSSEFAPLSAGVGRWLLPRDLRHHEAIYATASIQRSTRA